MKKIILLVCVALFTFSCNSDDSENLNEPDPIIGKWFFGNKVYKLDNGDDFIDNASFCDSQTFYRFNIDGTVELTSFVEDSGGCYQEPQNLTSFNWEKISDGNYRLSSVELDGTESTNVENVVFENENVMYWIDTFNGLTPIGDNYNQKWSYFNK